MIPKKIHYCWFGEDPFGPIQERCFASWKKYLPEYQYIHWKSAHLRMHIPYIARMYKQKRWAYLSDYMRFYALYEYGGIYMDLDVEVLKSLGDLLTERFVSGYENTSGKILQCHFLASRARHPFALDVLNFYQKDFRLRYSHPPVVPKVFAKIATKKYGFIKVKQPEEILLKEGIRIFPYNYFSPLPYEFRKNDNRQEYISGDSYVVHHWDYGWKPKGILHRLRVLPWAFMTIPEWWQFFRMCLKIFTVKKSKK